ncbi:MAG: ATP-binding protein [Pigmentiphaga sp.]
MTRSAASVFSRLKRARQRIARSIKLRLVLMLLLLAGAVALIFLVAAQHAFSVGWREAARPLLTDYVDRLAADITIDGAPSVARAQALVEHLPVTVRISGPATQWSSHPDTERFQSRNKSIAGDEPDWLRMRLRKTADGHTLIFGIDGEVLERHPNRLGYALAALLLLTLSAWFYVRRLLRPLDAINDGAQRFGAGDFSQPIPQRRAEKPDELDELTVTLNIMGRDIHQMLEAKRALLLAISHELRSPLTRARLHVDLLPESLAVQPHREALLRDLQEMTLLIGDLLESERLAGRHVALQCEPVDLEALAHAVARELAERHTAMQRVSIEADMSLPRLALDPGRMRLLLRNLLDNALRYGNAANRPPELHLRRTASGGVLIEVRDYGPGVPEPQLSQLAEAFYRPDTGRSRRTGGVGLGLYLCRLVTQAHGGTFEVRNANPGLVARVTLPPASSGAARSGADQPSAPA